jgi:hypothetical protein
VHTKILTAQKSKNDEQTHASLYTSRPVPRLVTWLLPVDPTSPDSVVIMENAIPQWQLREQMVWDQAQSRLPLQQQLRVTLSVSEVCGESFGMVIAGRSDLFRFRKRGGSDSDGVIITVVDGESSFFATVAVSGDY